ncbi:hypothetical protein P9139_08195 [Curtobacterium flaccumfaciens]|nr:hypothetical protein P9139_08195 [Curtobacterium flaccumfaciens]
MDPATGHRRHRRPGRARVRDSAERLYGQDFEVSSRSNHVGLRLSGTPPVRSSSAEVLSRGVPVGAVEVPSPSDLLVLHRGRGVTAGYPVLAVLTTASLDVMAQVRPGQQVRFRPTTVREARAEHLARTVALDRLRTRCWSALESVGLRGFGLGRPNPTTPSHPEGVIP